VTTQPPLSDERLAWLAARDHCRTRAESHSPIFWLFIVLSFGRAAWTRRAQTEDKMNDYAFVVDDLARRLSPDERMRLRATGKLPDWFLPAVDVEVVKQRNFREKA
jgi:hypothetical protein